MAGTTGLIECVYVAGPIAAPTEAERMRNIQTAVDIALEITKMGFAVICVHAKEAYWWGKIDEAVVIRTDLIELERSDGIVLAPGWEHSRGTVGEILHASWHGLPCWEPGMFLAGPLVDVLDRITPPVDLLARAQVEPHPASMDFGPPLAIERKAQLVKRLIVQ
jgi:hypothetical protein